MKNFKLVTRANLHLLEAIYESHQIKTSKIPKGINEAIKCSKSFNEGLLTAYLLLESENKEQFIEDFKNILKNSNDIEESLRQLERKL